MSRTFTCDHCQTGTAEPIELGYWVQATTDDEDDDVWEEMHMCSWPCLAAFALDQAMSSPVTP